MNLVAFSLMIIASLVLVTKANFIFVLFALEIMLLAVNVNFLCSALLFQDFLGQTIGLALFSLAATDTALGLALLLNYYNLRSLSSRQTLYKS